MGNQNGTDSPKFGRRGLVGSLSTGILILALLAFGGPGSAQPLTPPAITTPGFTSTDLDPYFQQADLRYSQQDWDAVIASGVSVLQANWETAVDAEINSRVASINSADAFNSVTEYRDYIRNELLLQKQKDKAAWTVSAEAAIRIRQLSFLTNLAADKKTTQENDSKKDTRVSAGNTATALNKADPRTSTNDQVVNALNKTGKQLEQDRLRWERKYRTGMKDGVNQFQTAISDVDKEYQAFLGTLSAKEAEFEQNRLRIKTYEKTVRDNMGTTITAMQNYLDNNGLFKEGGGGGLNADGLALQAFITSIQDGLTNNQPLAVLAKSMSDYMIAQDQKTRDARDYWQRNIRGRNPVNTAEGTGGQGRNLVNVGGTWTNAVHQYHTGGGDAALKAKLGETRDITAWHRVDAQGWSADHRPYPNTVGTARVNEWYSAAGDGAFSYDGSGCGFLVVLICVTEQFSEAQANIAVDYSWYDSVADNNHTIWSGYADDLAPLVANWRDNILPAITNWETQATQYETDFQAWKTDAAAKRTAATTTYQANRLQLARQRDVWIGEMQTNYRKGRRDWAVRQAAFKKREAAIKRGLKKGASKAVMNRLRGQTGAVIKNLLSGLPSGPSSPDVKRRIAAATKDLPTLEKEFLDRASAGAPDFSKISGLVNDFRGAAKGLLNLNSASAMHNQAVLARQQVMDRINEMASSAGFTGSVDANGNLSLTRQIPDGSAALKPGGNAENPNDYSPGMTAQNLVVTPPKSVALANTGALFSDWDMQAAVTEFSQSLGDFNSIASEKGTLAVGQVKDANGYAQFMQQEFQRNASSQAATAGLVRSLVTTLVTGGTVNGWMESQVQGAFASAIEEATGIPAGLVTGILFPVLGGANLGETVTSYTQSLFVEAVEEVTGMPGLGGFMLQMHRNRNRGNDIGLQADVSYSNSDGFHAEVDAGFGFGHMGFAVDAGNGGVQASASAGFDVGFAEFNNDTMVGYSGEDGFSAYSATDFSLDLGIVNANANSLMSYTEDTGLNAAVTANVGLDIGIVDIDAGVNAAYLDGNFAATADVGVDIGYGLVSGNANAGVAFSEDGTFAAHANADVGIGYGLVDLSATTTVAYADGGVVANADAGVDIANGLVSVNANTGLALTSEGNVAAWSGADVGVGYGLLDVSANAAAAYWDGGFAAYADAGFDLAGGLISADANAAAAITEDGDFAAMAGLDVGVGWGLADVNADVAGAYSQDGGFVGSAGVGFDLAGGLISGNQNAGLAVTGDGNFAGTYESNLGVGYGLVDMGVNATAAYADGGFIGSYDTGFDVAGGLFSANTHQGLGFTADGDFVFDQSANANVGWGLAEGGVNSTMVYTDGAFGATAGAQGSYLYGYESASANANVLFADGNLLASGSYDHSVLWGAGRDGGSAALGIWDGNVAATGGYYTDTLGGLMHEEYQASALFMDGNFAGNYSHESSALYGAYENKQDAYLLYSGGRFGGMYSEQSQVLGQTTNESRTTYFYDANKLLNPTADGFNAIPETGNQSDLNLLHMVMGGRGV